MPKSPDELLAEVRELRLRQVMPGGTHAAQERYRDVGENSLEALLAYTALHPSPSASALAERLRASALAAVEAALGKADGH
jgi:hypothetical protein